jgi:sugar phosphate isomerase/epimerase
MAYTSGKSYEAMYAGSYGPLDPQYGDLFTGYRVPFSSMGAPTSPQTANQITEVTNRLNEGLRAVEVGPISPELFEGIPKQHLKEINRLGKLTGAEFSLHAPQIDPAGFSREGWNESNRAESEQRIKNVIERAHQLSPDGNIPIVVHATGGLPSTEWMHEEGKPQVQVLYVVNRETGALDKVEREAKYFPTVPMPGAKPAMWEVGEKLEMKNNTAWDSMTFPLTQHIKESGEILARSWPKAAGDWARIAVGESQISQKYANGEITSQDANEMFAKLNETIDPEARAAFSDVKMAQRYQEEIAMHLRTLYEMAYKYAPEENKEAMREEIRKKSAEFKAANQQSMINPAIALTMYHDLTASVNEIRPQMFIPTDQFAIEKSKETIANAALHAYKKFGENAPIIALENFMAGTVCSRAEELKKLVTESREAFVKKAKDAGIGEGSARDAAKKLIGATWDAGHINMLRKYGYKPETIVEETKKIAPFVKHVHLHDNFGFEDSHLPPGMGEVPLKDMLRELEKAGYKGKEIIEAGGWVAQFKTSPTPYVLEALGSPMYASQMQPFWNQVRGGYGIPGGYGSGYGMMLPEQHFGTYGAGFSTLPMEIGGTMPGKGQRFAGAPME